MLFRELSPSEVIEFQTYAEKNDPPANWRTICHPVCVEVWIRRGFADDFGRRKTMLERLKELDQFHSGPLSKDRT